MSRLTFYVLNIKRVKSYSKSLSAIWKIKKRKIVFIFQARRTSIPSNSLQKKIKAVGNDRISHKKKQTGSLITLISALKTFPEEAPGDFQFTRPSGFKQKREPNLSRRGRLRSKAKDTSWSQTFGYPVKPIQQRKGSSELSFCKKEGNETRKKIKVDKLNNIVENIEKMGKVQKKLKRTSAVLAKQYWKTI